MACDTPFAVARDYAELICTSTLDLTKEARINRQLTITAGAIHAAMGASDQCTCTLEAWAENYLKHLNIVLAAATQDCPCSTISNEEKAAYLAFATAELEKIRTGQIDVCGGTGRDYPAFGNIELGLNIFNQAQIIENRIQRTFTP
jgi:hypothetical protein